MLIPMRKENLFSIHANVLPGEHLLFLGGLSAWLRGGLECDDDDEEEAWECRSRGEINSSLFFMFESTSRDERFCAANIPSTQGRRMSPSRNCRVYIFPPSRVEGTCKRLNESERKRLN